MICVWWDWESMLHWVMLEKNATVKKELYLAQLRRVNKAMRLKGPDRQGQVVLLHDNARPYVAKVVKTALQELEWEVNIHPPAVAPTDYHLFPSLSNQIKGIIFSGEKDLKNWLNNFFDTRPGDFWRNGNDKLIERWEVVVNSNSK